jgi:hypothetical protein
MAFRVQYDAIAATYDRRYVQNDYSGVAKALTDFAGSESAGRVLEVGCGTGHWLRLLAEKGIRVAVWTHRHRCWPRPALRSLALDSPWGGLRTSRGPVRRSTASSASTPFITSRTRSGRLDQGATSQLAVPTDEEHRRGVERIRKALESAEGRGELLYLSAALRLFATVGRCRVEATRRARRRPGRRPWRAASDAASRPRSRKRTAARCRRSSPDRPGSARRRGTSRPAE